MISSTGENLVFILSPPRSGSTLLGAMLGSHSGVACPSEPWFLLRLAAVYASATTLGWHDDGLAAMATRAFVDPDTFRRGARELAATVYNAHLERAGRRFFVDKTPRYYHIVGFLADTFPQAKLIWLQRNPFAIAASFKTTWNIETDVLTGRCLTPHSFDLSLALRTLARHFDQRSPAQLIVRYEDLVTEPVAELRRVCDFLDIPFEERMLSYGENDALIEAYRRSDFGDRSLLDHRSAHRHSIDRWRTLLSPDEIADIQWSLGSDLLDRLGYESPAPPPTEERVSNAAVSAVLARDRSPAEPAEQVRDAATDLVPHALASADLTRELTQTRAERDRWRAAYAELEKSRDSERAANEPEPDTHPTIEDIVDERDRWQAKHRHMEASRDHYREAYHAMVADRNRWQAAQHTTESDRDHYREQYYRLSESAETQRKDSQQAVRNLTQERDHWRLAYGEVEDLLRRVPLRIALAIVRGFSRLSRADGPRT